MSPGASRPGEVLAWLFTLAAGAYFFTLPLADNDLWGHVLFGQEILREGLVRENRYAYTAPDHPWVNHEILAEVALGGVWGAFGNPGLRVLKIALGLATLALVFVACRRRTDAPLVAAGGAALAASLMSFGYLFRPQIFTFLFLALLWERLVGFADGAHGRRGVVWLPALFALWVNVHGGVLAGAGILAAFAVLFPLSERRPREGLFLGATAAAALLALLLNPYGPELPRFLVADVRLERNIGEWDAIVLGDLSNLHWKGAVLFALLAPLATRRGRPWELAVVALAAFVSQRHVRHLPLFGIVVAPWITLQASALASRLGPRLALGPGARRLLAAGVVAIVLVVARRPVSLWRDLGGEIYVSPELYPVRAFEFLRANGLGGNVAVPFGWGEYAIWHLPPGSRVSIDGRYTTAYPAEVIAAAWRYMEGTPGWDELLAGAAIAVADRRHATAVRLAAHPDWVYVHSDPTAIVFVRRGLVADVAALDRSLPERPRGAFFP